LGVPVYEPPTRLNVHCVSRLVDTEAAAGREEYNKSATDNLPALSSPAQLLADLVGPEASRKTSRASESKLMVNIDDFQLGYIIGIVATFSRLSVDCSDCHNIFNNCQKTFNN